MTELEKFAEKYIRLVRDNVLKRFEPGEIEELLSNNGGPINADGYAAMNQSQREVLDTMLTLAVDAQMVMMLAMTSRGEKSPWCLVDRDKAVQAGLSSITEGIDVMSAPYEWIDKYSEF